MILVDDSHALMSMADFEELPEYSCSLPSLTTIGKRWKRGAPYVGVRTHWWLGEYEECDPPDPEKVQILWRTIVIVD